MRLMVLGKFGTGKTTVSDYAIERYGFKRAMLATGLKKMAELIQYPNKEWELLHLINDVIDASDLDKSLINKMHDHLLKLKNNYPSKKIWNLKNILKFLITGKSPEFIKNRSLLQELGTQFRESYHDNIWINYTYKKIVQPLVESGTPVVIDDVRFKNEYDFFYERNFLPIRINSKWQSRKERLLQRDGVVNEDRLNHISETDLDEYNESNGIHELHNDISLESLLSEVDKKIKGEMKNVR